MLRCDDVLAAISSFLDRDLDEETRRHVEAHLHECRTCTAIYDSTRKTLTLVTDAASLEVPADLTARIMARLRARE